MRRSLDWRMTYGKGEAVWRDHPKKTGLMPRKNCEAAEKASNSDRTRKRTRLHRDRVDAVGHCTARQGLMRTHPASSEIRSIDGVGRIHATEPAPSAGDCVCVSKAMREITGFVRRLATSEARTILLQGETGVGKDKIANDLHQMSPRCGKQFLPVNCAAIPEVLFESELFGYERGA